MWFGHLQRSEPNESFDGIVRGTEGGVKKKETKRKQSQTIHKLEAELCFLIASLAH